MSTTRFKGIDHYGYAELNEQLEDNYSEWLRWNLLGIGAFENVRIPSSGHYGGDKAILRPVNDPRYSSTTTATRVWEGYKNDWVWESGISYSTQPIAISGVYVNGTFQPAPTATGYIIDYPRGRIIFNTAIAATSVVKCEYTTRHVTVGKSTQPWAKNLLLNAYRVDLPDASLYGSGIFNQLVDNRIIPPAIIVEAYPQRSYDGRELGGGHVVYQDLVFHIFAANTFDRNQLIDVISTQYDSTIVMYDRNSVGQSGQFPLNAYGSLVNSAYNFPYLVNNHFYNKSVIKDVSVSHIPTQGVFNAAVRYTVEVIRGDI